MPPSSSANYIYLFQRRLSERLLLWSLVSMLAGAVLALTTRRPNRRAFGVQTVGWGAIDALIALGGGYATWRRAANPSAQQPAARQREADNLRRLLWANAGLDLLYALGGVWLICRPDPQRRGWRGHGWAVIVQAIFLFVFDVFHARRLADGEPHG